jgi:hypothetical protein
LPRPASISTAREDDDGGSAEQLAALRDKTEQYCVVMQTLLRPPKLLTEWGEDNWR